MRLGGEFLDGDTYIWKSICSNIILHITDIDIKYELQKVEVDEILLFWGPDIAEESLVCERFLGEGDAGLYRSV